MNTASSLACHQPPQPFFVLFFLSAQDNSYIIPHLPESFPRTILQVLLVEGEVLANNLAIDEPVELVEGVGEVGSLRHNLRSLPFDFLCPGSLYCMVLCL